MSSTLRPTSTLECVAALRALGFDVERLTERLVVMRRSDGRRVSVPLRAVLSANEVGVLLHVANVTPESFLTALAGQTTPREAIVGATSEVRERPDYLESFDKDLSSKKG